VKPTSSKTSKKTKTTTATTGATTKVIVPRAAEPLKPGFRELLAFLKSQRGFEFDAYKTSSLERRVDKRMHDVRCATYVGYVDYLEVHPDEYAHLFNTILINVTAFFRDEPAWTFLRTSVIPKLVATKGKVPIRVWSAGCSSGEEPYSIAILLAEALGLEAFTRLVKVYATDVDEEALAQGRAATYAEKDVAAVPAPYLAKYFERVGNRYAICKELRRAVIFGRHDLLQDAPISRVDLLLCRNALMYFAAEAQARILERLHFALAEDGVLFLGKAEMLLGRSSLFTAINLKQRIFVRAAGALGTMRDRPRALLAAGGTSLLENPRELAETLFEVHHVADLVFDHEGNLVLANERARVLFRLDLRERGQRLQDLELSYRPLEIRSRIEEAYATGRMVEVRDVEFAPGTKDTRTFDVQVLPLFDGANVQGVQVSFVDVSRFRGLQIELRKSHQELEAAYEELQSTGEELETTNEELQSTVEELETTNEELQSTNEELETMNEELQSTNEELQTMNTELRDRGHELNRLNVFFGAVLTSFSAGLVVADADFHVTVWNGGAEELWGLRSQEAIGKHLFNLDIGLPFETLKKPLRAALHGESPPAVVVRATNRRGRTVDCRVACTPLVHVRDVGGVILFMEIVRDNGAAPKPVKANGSGPKPVKAAAKPLPAKKGKTR
jgi:two-component system CheB/CheR fusion protein